MSTIHHPHRNCIRHSLLLLLLLSLHAASCLAANDDIYLVQFKASLKGTLPLDATWIQGTNPCDKQKPWEGVDCSDSGGASVSSILLLNHGLSGDAATLNIEALSHLESLRILSLENNSFSGPIPGFNRLSSLKSLFLGGNGFIGEIPPDYFINMRSLKRIHLSRNKFTGPIPDSLVKIGSLREVMLQRNEFSGPVPSFEQNTLETIDLSYNKLQGEIPQSMSRFPPQAVEGNPDVCGAVINKPCMGLGANAQVPGHQSDATKWAILGIVVALLLVTLLFKAKKKESGFSAIGENVNDQGAQGDSHSVNRRASISKRSPGAQSDIESQSAKKSMQAAKPSNDIVMINDEKGAFKLPDLMKAAAEVLGGGNLGSAYRATMVNGLSVVVKRIKHMNKLNRDLFDIEVRKFGRIRHRNILPPLAYHYRKEEKLLVTEYMCNGSLLLRLHGDRGPDHVEFNWPTRLKILKGVARGMGFLHTEFANCELPHGNLKSSNVLLTSNYEPVLTDYALYSLLSNHQSIQALAASKSPEAVQENLLTHKSDVYCLGIVILETLTRKFPSQYASNQRGGTDIVQWVKHGISENRIGELVDPEISNDASKDSLDQMEKMMRIGALCTESDHEQRVEMREAIRSIEEIAN